MAGEVRQFRFVRPPGATSLLLVRHGESAPARPDEPFALVDGQGDPALAPAGRQQAQRVAERLAGEPIAAIYVTTLRRTAETAAPLAGRGSASSRSSSRAYGRSTSANGKAGCSGSGSPKAIRSPSGWSPRSAGMSSLAPSRPGVRRPGARLVGAGRAAASGPDRGGLHSRRGHRPGAGRRRPRRRPFAFAGADNGSISHLVITSGPLGGTHVQRRRPPASWLRARR